MRCYLEFSRFRGSNEAVDGEIVGGHFRFNNNRVKLIKEKGMNGTRLCRVKGASARASLMGKHCGGS